MTQLLDRLLAAEPAVDEPADRYARTIKTYDYAAVHHAQRLAQVDFDRYLKPFRDRLSAGATVLDGGCGAGRDLRWMNDHGLKTIGLDASAGMLAQAAAAAPESMLIHGDLRAIPLGDAAVDGAWLCASLLHLAPRDAATALAEVARVLRPEGIVFISTAAGEGSRWGQSEQGPRWFQLYGQPDVAGLLDRVGLQVLESSTEPGVVQGTWVNVTARKPSRPPR